MMINKIIQTFLNYCKSIKLADSTLENYSNVLSKFEKFIVANSINGEEIEVNEITVKMVKAYFIDMQQNYAIATVKQHHAVLSTFYRWLVDDAELVEYNLLASVKPRFKHESKRQPVVRSSDMADILNVLNNVPKTRRTFRYWRNKFMMQVMYSCGLRVSEVLNLKYSDYNEADHSFSYTMKGSKDHVIFIADEDMLDTFEKLRSMRNKKFPECDYVFSSANGEKMSRPGVRYIIDTVSKDAGIEKHLTPHSFRRGCATALLENGADIAVVKDILGHANIGTTMLYTNLSEKAMKNTMHKFNPLSNVR